MAEALPIMEPPKEEVLPVTEFKPIPGGKRSRRTGVGMVSLTPVMADSISEDEEDDISEDRAEDIVNNNSVPNPDSLANLNESPTTSRMTMSNVRKLSDVTFHKFVGRLRRKSEPVAPFGMFPRKEIVPTSSSFPRPLGYSRTLSMDLSGILKRPTSSSGEVGVPIVNPNRHRKSVSFSQHDHVKVIEALGQKCHLEVDLDEDESEFDCEDMDSNPKSLIPTFVYPGKKPNFGSTLANSVVMLESLTISADYCIVGNIRVNLNKLRAKHLDNGLVKDQKITVGVTYSMDDWETTKQAFAMPVRTRKRKDLEDLETLALRFVIECQDLEIGESVQFVVFCVDKSQGLENQTQAAYEDNNEKQLYQVACSAKLNPWAAKAAKELANFAPTIKFNKNYF